MNSGTSYRQSRQRRRILQLLKETHTHPTVDWMYQQLKPEFPKLSLGTIYRNLSILTEQGLVNKIKSGSTFDRFEANTGTHYHFICESCGCMQDLEMPVRKDLNDEARQFTNFDVQKHQIHFFGLCSDCRSKKTAD
ncbi:transcriptional repressor [bacterium]|nr:transcriptional repressor [bacterium]